MTDQPQVEVLPRRDTTADNAPVGEGSAPSAAFDAPGLLSQFDSVIGNNRNAIVGASSGSSETGRPADKAVLSLNPGFTTLQLDNPFSNLDSFAPLQLSPRLQPVSFLAKEGHVPAVGVNLDTNGTGHRPALAESDEQTERRDQPTVEPADASDRAAKPRDNASERTPATPLVSSERFGELAKEVLARIDTANTGRVDKQQLAKALEDPSITGEHAQVLAALYTNYDKLKNFSGQQGFFDKGGVSAADIDSFQQRSNAQQNAYRDSTSLVAWGDENLKRFDRSGGGVTTQDIDVALASPATSDTDRQMLSLLKDHYARIQGTRPPNGSEVAVDTGLNAQDLRAYQQQQASSPVAQLRGDIQGMMQRVSQGQQPGVTRDLFGNKENPLESIKPDAITQGHIGNCYLVAAIASVAQSNPQAIRDMIKDNGNGTYTVTFPGAKDNPITVKAPTQAEQGIFNGASQHGTWASVLEKAAGELYNQGWLRSIIGRTNSPAEGGDGGGLPGNALRLLTGNDTEFFTTSLNSQRNIADQLTAAFAEKPPRAVTASTFNLPFSDNTADGFARGHAFSITGFTPDGKGGGLVTIRNPWNGGEGTTAGTTQISLEAFMRNFGYVSFEKRR